MISSSILTILICAKLATSSFGFLTGNGIVIKNENNFRSSFSLAAFVLEETWDETLRDLATDALLPVIYNSQSEELSKVLDRNYDHLYTESTKIDAERALKKCLRIYQKIIHEKDIGAEERQRSRKRLNDLVLGTSLMRIRYQFLCKYEFDNSQSKSEKRKVMRRMIDMHADFLDGNINEDMLKPIDAIESTIERISVKYSLPFFFLEMMVQQYGSTKAEEFADTFSKRGPIYLRRNSIRCRSDQALRQRLKDECFANVLKSKVEKNHPEGCLQLLPDENWNPSKISIWSMNAWKNGWFEVQDAGSQIIASALEAKHHETIVDYCSGNGGKSFAIASYMNSDAMVRGCQPMGHIISNDSVSDRMKQLKGSFTRTGCNSLQPDLVQTTLGDGVQFTESVADAVLVDAPCSSTGVLRRRPSQRFKMNQKEITKDFPRIQLQILKEASKLVKSGGRLVYATCSIFAQENQDVANAFENSIHFIWEPWPFDDDDNNEQSHYKSLLPNEDNDGFFIARWKRKTQR